jgi:hypothetical protein
LQFNYGISTIGSDRFNSEIEGLSEAERHGDEKLYYRQRLGEKRYVIFNGRKPGLAPETGTGWGAPPRT